ncbi:MAG: AGE family epimerase/isomerase, partial [Candidatus Omnitrophica bacterium]|nr:AGE family epimerase/isomerase [Candidatus Omnitrophota bacterium]
LDYFSDRLRIPMSEIRKYSDANGIYGILKLLPSVDDPKTVGLVNALDRTSLAREGRAQLEYWSTPGPMAFLVFAFLQVDREKYLPDALRLGEALRGMQREDGAITDGDRNPVNVHTEPHMDTMSAFLQLYEVTHDEQWKAAADRAWGWFEKNVYRPEQGIIYQGIRGAAPSEVFATDTYSWTMCGPAGDRLPLDVLQALTDRMLERSVSRVTLELPDGKTKTVTLVDFADINDKRILTDRGGFHPMGSVEWIGGVILALQKNAVRFWEAGDEIAQRKARIYKALAEYFTRQALDSFYTINGLDGLLSFYATGQWIPTGHGWRTPYFYVKDKTGRPIIQGGSSIGSWPVLPLMRKNPFFIHDQYGAVYDVIPHSADTDQEAASYVDTLVASRAFQETVPKNIAEGVGESPEMWRYNQNMFLAFGSGDYYAAIMWAEKVLADKDFVERAKEQQKRKEREVGGLVDYPWGTATEKANDAFHAVQRYSLLNDVGAAMWGLAVAHFKLNDRDQAKAWIRTMIETVPYHQIYAPDGPGYWNAIVSWETNPGGTALDAEMGTLYHEVLVSMGKSSAMPKVYTK